MDKESLKTLLKDFEDFALESFEDQKDNFVDELGYLKGAMEVFLDSKIDELLKNVCSRCDEVINETITNDQEMHTDCYDIWINDQETPVYRTN